MHLMKHRCAAGLAFNPCRVNLLFNPICYPTPYPCPQFGVQGYAGQTLGVARPQYTQTQVKQPEATLAESQTFNGGRG